MSSHCFFMNIWWKANIDVKKSKYKASINIDEQDYSWSWSLMQFNFESPYIVKLAKLEFQKTNKITKI